MKIVGSSAEERDVVASVGAGFDVQPVPMTQTSLADILEEPSFAAASDAEKRSLLGALARIEDPLAEHPTPSRA
ncbi:MAG: hypothetical protein KF850_00280 [Labilithrix sp.]|nr:hypothetical protein [Labilithrix sp.]